MISDKIVLHSVQILLQISRCATTKSKFVYYVSCISIYREKSHEYDFLSSIEVIIADQTDVFLMQNWEHVQVCILLYQPL